MWCMWRIETIYNVKSAIQIKLYRKKLDLIYTPSLLKSYLFFLHVHHIWCMRCYAWEIRCMSSSEVIFVSNRLKLKSFFDSTISFSVYWEYKRQHWVCFISSLLTANHRSVVGNQLVHIFLNLSCIYSRSQRTAHVERLSSGDYLDQKLNYPAVSRWSSSHPLHVCHYVDTIITSRQQVVLVLTNAITRSGRLVSGLEWSKWPETQVMRC